MDVCMGKKKWNPFCSVRAGKDYLWGGKRLNDEYGKNIELSPLAETWECSTHPDGVSTVRCGTFDKMELTAVIKAHPGVSGRTVKGRNNAANPGEADRCKKGSVCAGASG